MSKRRDSKRRVLRNGESIRKDGRYQFKYYVNGKIRFVYSWRLEATDRLPVGKKPGPSLRELEKQLGYDLLAQIDPDGKNMTVEELVERYLATKINAKPLTINNYNYARNVLKKDDFYYMKIGNIKTSDAKLFLIRLQQNGKSYSAVKTVRGVLRPAFQMAVDDDTLLKNPFNFQLAGVVINDSKTREAISRDQMRKFLKFVHDDNVYCKYYEVVYILFHTGMRISEFCGLTIDDIDLENKTVRIERQLQRVAHVGYFVETTKTSAGKRVIPISDDVAYMFRAILEDRPRNRVERPVDGYSGFLFIDKDGMPLVAMHWSQRFKHMWERYNEIYRVPLPKISPHVCRHTYCSNMAKSGMNPKTLQYLMGHSEIGITMNTYTHLGLEDAEVEMHRLEDIDNARREMEKNTERPVNNGGRRLFRIV